MSKTTRWALAVTLFLASPFLALITWRGYELALGAIGHGIGVHPAALQAMSVVAAFFAFIAWAMTFLAALSISDIEKIDPDGAQSMRRAVQTERIVAAYNRAAAEMESFRDLIERRP